jgi:hypothetical protein
MVNGRLYEAATMQEVGNYQKNPGRFYWENGKVGTSFPYTEGQDVHTIGIAGEQCTCRH